VIEAEVVLHEGLSIALERRRNDEEVEVFGGAER
jgi:hypothetical protein